MDPAAVLANLLAAGAKLRTNGVNVFVIPPHAGLTDAQRTAIKEHKVALVALLSPRPAPPCTDNGEGRPGGSLHSDRRGLVRVVGAASLPQWVDAWPEPWKSEHRRRLRCIVDESGLDEKEASRKVEGFVRRWAREESADLDGARIVNHVTASNAERQIPSATCGELPPQIEDWRIEYLQCFNDLAEVPATGRTAESVREAEIVVRGWHRDFGIEPAVLGERTTP